MSDREELQVVVRGPKEARNLLLANINLMLRAAGIAAVFPSGSDRQEIVNASADSWTAKRDLERFIDRYDIKLEAVDPEVTLVRVKVTDQLAADEEEGEDEATRG